MGFKSDYGLRLSKQGISSGVDIFFYDFRLFSISVLGPESYSTTVEMPYEGEMHALSLDFNQAQLKNILARADPSVNAFVWTELARDPYSARSIDLDGHVSFAVRSRLGVLQTVAQEEFIPLVAQEIL
jgi:hypothetical protein